LVISYNGITGNNDVKLPTLGTSICRSIILSSNFSRQSVITIDIAFLALTSDKANFISFKWWSFKIIIIIHVDFGLSGSIKANGPCLSSPAENASAWIYVNSFNFKAPSFAIAEQGPLPKTIRECLLWSDYAIFLH